jgi:hypothetical protein
LRCDGCSCCVVHLRRGASFVEKIAICIAANFAAGKFELRRAKRSLSSHLAAVKVASTNRIQRERPHPELPVSCSGGGIEFLRPSLVAALAIDPRKRRMAKGGQGTGFTVGGELKGDTELFF